jgi:hypothetical protein
MGSAPGAGTQRELGVGLAGPEARLENIDPVALYDQVARIGFPAFFVYGLMRGWWYMRAHVDELRGRLAELVEQVKSQNAASDRATSLAEASHLIAAEALEQARRNAALADRTEATLTSIEAHLARLPAGCPPTVSRPPASHAAGGEG